MRRVVVVEHVDTHEPVAATLEGATPGLIVSPAFRLVRYVPEEVALAGGPIPMRHLEALRRLVAYGKASAAETLRLAHSGDTRPGHRPLYMGRSDGFANMADTLGELVHLMERQVPGVVPLRPLRWPVE